MHRNPKQWPTVGQCLTPTLSHGITRQLQPLGHVKAGHRGRALLLQQQRLALAARVKCSYNKYIANKCSSNTNRLIKRHYSSGRQQHCAAIRARYNKAERNLEALKSSGAP